MKFKDISLYFKSDCCNTTEKPIGNTEIGESLVEPIEKNGTLERAFKFFHKICHLDIQEICCTFKPKYHQFNATALHNLFRKTIKKYFNKYSYFRGSYLFIPEYNSSGILHYHGIVYFHNANEYWSSDLKRMLNNKFGICKGKTVYDIANYKKYITKDLDKEKFTVRPFASTLNNLSS